MSYPGRAVPWTLRYTNDIDGRITRNAHQALFRELGAGDVSSLTAQNRPEPRLVVTFRDDENQTAVPELRQLYREYGVEDRTLPVEPLLRREVRGFDTNAIISQYLQNPERRSRLAQAMAAPLRQRIDYQSVARRTLLVEQLPDGALSVYNGTPSVGEMAVTTGRDGWDANGSPVREIPSWVKVGAWAYSARRDEYAQVVGVKGLGEIRLQTWRSPEPPRWVDVDYMYEQWAPCEEPSEPRPFWERLLEDDLSWWG